MIPNSKLINNQVGRILEVRKINVLPKQALHHLYLPIATRCKLYQSYRWYIGTIEFSFVVAVELLLHENRQRGKQAHAEMLTELITERT